MQIFLMGLSERYSLQKQTAQNQRTEKKTIQQQGSASVKTL
jgi:hypothetical protein